jgi:3-oxoacyl-[acyl-carrier-protein] synthase-3
MSSVGILGLGTYLPRTVRTNDHWSSAIVADWHDRMAARATRPDAPAPETLSSGVRRTLAAMQEYAKDPFRGAVERRVMSDEMTTSEMEAFAAKEAMQRAGIDASQIGAIFTQTPAPECVLRNSAAVTHRLLGLSPHCLVTSTSAACNAFATHVALAKGLIASGQARYVLSVHSSAMTRVMRDEEPDSAWWGDGASAAVIGAVSDGKGLLAVTHDADGTSCNAITLGVPGRRWWEDGQCTIHAPDREHTRAMLLNLVDRAGASIAKTLQVAGIHPEDVKFYASHQGTVWFTAATAAQAGLERAKTVVTFPSFGNIASASIPLVLAIGEREGMIRDGTIVVTFAGGAGEVWSSMCFRWGK